MIVLARDCIGVTVNETLMMRGGNLVSENLPALSLFQRRREDMPGTLKFTILNT